MPALPARHSSPDTAMSTLYLVRPGHASPDAARSTLYRVRHGPASCGTDDYEHLSAVGRQQVELLGQFFAESGEKIVRVYSGSLHRQREAAEILASALDLEAPIVSD